VAARPPCWRAARAASRLGSQAPRVAPPPRVRVGVRVRVRVRVRVSIGVGVRVRARLRLRLRLRPRLRLRLRVRVRVTSARLMLCRRVSAGGRCESARHSRSTSPRSSSRPSAACIVRVRVSEP